MRSMPSKFLPHVFFFAYVYSSIEKSDTMKGEKFPLALYILASESIES